MQHTLKDYEGHKYIEYYDAESGEVFTNANYFIFDVICADFKALMKNTGGFTANMTTRMIEKLNLPCKSIMMCCSPNKNNEFLFQIAYLDENQNVLHIEWDNSYFDYAYFRKKFSDCIIEEGCIFDLLEQKQFQEITKEFKNPSVSFDIQIDGREITTEDTLICKDLCFLKEEHIEKFKKFGIAYAEITYKIDCFHPYHFHVRFVKEDGNYLQNWQGLYGYQTLEEYKNENTIDDFDMKDFEQFVSIPVLRHFINHFSLKEDELEEQEEKEL